MAIACAAFLAVPIAAPVAAGLPSDATSSLVALINQDRSDHGLGAVSLNGTLSTIAQAQAEAMAAAGRIFQNPAFPADVPDANAAGENVGYGATPDSINAAFVASPEHQANMVNPAYREVGIGSAPSPIGLMVVEDFADQTGSAPVPAPPRQEPSPAPPLPKPAPKPVTVAPVTAPAPVVSTPSTPPPPPPPPPTIDVALYSRMLQWAQWQATDGPSPAGS